METFYKRQNKMSQNKLKSRGNANKKTGRKEKKKMTGKRKPWSERRN